MATPMDFEDISIDTRLPYRFGFPTLVTLPFDFHWANISQYVQDRQKFIGEICNIVGDLGMNVKPEAIKFLYQYHSGHRQDETVTLRISSFYDKDCHQTWIPAIKAIHQKLQSLKLPFVIEICDMEMRFDPRTHRMPPRFSNEEKIQEAVRELAPIIQEEIIKHSFITVDIIPSLYSFIHHEFRPVFIICARDADDSLWWDVTLPSIRQKFDQTKHEFEVELFYLENIILCASGPFRANLPSRPLEEADGKIQEYFYHEPRVMATSCGLKGQDRGGTWGGKVVLKKDGQNLELGLTCCHVLPPEICKAQGKEANEKDEGSASSSTKTFDPFKPGDSIRKQMVVSPSDEDHARRVTKWETKLAEGRQELELLEQRLIFRELTEWQKKRKAALESGNETLEIQLSIMRTSNRDMGPIYAASGNTKIAMKTSGTWKMTDNWLLDWTLFQLKPTHQHGNFGIPLMQWSPVEPNKTYKATKQGRTTGKTTLHITGFQSLTRAERIQTGKQVKMSPTQPNITEVEWSDYPGLCTMHTMWAESESEMNDVLRPGDSGSLILQEQDDSSQKVLGMGFGINPETKVCYMMPAEAIVKSIEKVTGGEVLGFLCPGPRDPPF